MRATVRWLYHGLRAALLVAWLLGTAWLAWLMLVFPNQPANGRAKDYPVELPPGLPLGDVAKRLTEEGVISQPRAWVVYMRFIGAEHRLRSGWVVLNRSVSPLSLLPRIAHGYGRAEVKVLVPEGYTHFDVAARLARFGIAPEQDLLAAMRDPALLATLQVAGSTAEGYLFPATYTFRQGTPAAQVVTRMVSVFHKRTQALFETYALEHAGAAFSLTPHQLLTLASIVEREAAVPEERSVIAGVFMNRLTHPSFRPRRLQADPTVAYGCLIAKEAAPSCRAFDGHRITPAMVRDPENPYSTYRHEGLPPGPICNPGLAAIEASLHPDVHDFFYFVAAGGGRHAFSHSLDEHNRQIHGDAGPRTSVAQEVR